MAGVWIVSGDYKRRRIRPAQPFESARCDVLISEATFALALLPWPQTREVVAEIFRWWMDESRARGRASALFCYALGKAQRVLAELTGSSPNETVYLHGAVAPLVEAISPARRSDAADAARSSTRRKADYAGALIIAPPSAAGTPWMRRFGEALDGILLRLDARARRPAPARLRPRLRAFRPCGLAGAAARPASRERRDRACCSPMAIRHALARFLREQGVNAAALAHGLRRRRVDAASFAELYEELDTTTSTNASSRRWCATSAARRLRMRRGPPTSCPVAGSSASSARRSLRDG